MQGAWLPQQLLSSISSAVPGGITPFVAWVYHINITMIMFLVWDSPLFCNHVSV
jgi:hypothetical protein